MFGLLFLLGVASAEPEFTKLEKGDAAPWEGRLFNAEAVSKFIVEDKFKIEQCEIQIDYSLEKQKAELGLEHKKEIVELRTQIAILEQKLSLRNDRIHGLEKIKTPPNPFWYSTAGFLIGSGVTVGISYTVNQ